MATAVKLDIIIPESHEVRLTVPDEVPSGPARVIFVPATEPAQEPAERAEGARSLADLFAGHIGLIDSGGEESLSEDGGEKLTDHLEAKRRAGHL